jgi:hypothetical protein
MTVSYNTLLPRTRYALTLTSGTSWTVPAGVTYVNVTLIGGGGGGSATGTSATAAGVGGTTSFTGATSAAGGAAATAGAATFLTPGGGITVPASTPNSGKGGFCAGEYGNISSTNLAINGFMAPDGQTITSTIATTPGAGITYAIGAGGTGGGGGTSGSSGAAGGSGRIDIEYWV